MSDKMKKFSINDIKLYENDDSVDFAFAKIYFLSDGDNEQNCPISLETLKKYADTVKGKFIVAKYHNYIDDVGSHELDEEIVGYCPPDSEVTFEYSEEYQKTFAICDAVISKLYGTGMETYKLFTVDNERSVSTEFSTNIPNPDENDEGEIIAFDVHSVTILGKMVRPAVSGANIKIMKFSAEKAENYYNSKKENILKQFAEERKEKLNLVSHPIDKSKDAISDSDWNGDKAKHDLIKEKNFKTLAKSVCLKLEDGWEDKQVTSLKYPVMGLKDDKWVYFSEGLSSARTYGEQYDQSVADKAIAIQKKLGLYKEEDNKEKQMSIEKEKTFAVEIGNLWCLIYDILCSKYPDRDYGSIYRICGIYEENGNKFAIIYKKDETCQYKLNFEVTNSEITMSDDIVEVETTFVESENIRKFSEDGEDKYKNFVKEDIVMEKDKDKDIKDPKEKEMGCKNMEDDDDDDDKEEMKKMKDKKKFSLDAYVDSIVTLAMLEKETEDNKKLADKVMKEMSADEIVSTVLSFAKENEDLKKYKDEKQKEDKEKKLSSIMASVKEDLDEKQFSELQDEAKTLSFEQLDGFSNKVKAFAYEATKGKNKKTDNEDGIMKFAKSNWDVNTKSQEETSLWN